MKDKVYCSECRWLQYSGVEIMQNREQTWVCPYCENKDATVDSWYGKNEFRFLPKEINRNNDCKWFEKK